jgi:voltage-gated potassium channel
VFAAIAIFAGLTLHEYHQSHKLFGIERCEAGKVIFRQGDTGDCVYFIRQGEVEVVREENGAVLATLQAGQYFGEMALLSNKPRNATVRTLTTVELAVLGKENFLSMLTLLPEAEEAILTTVHKRAMQAVKEPSS